MSNCFFLQVNTSHFIYYSDFCLRFADDFETSWDDWKPDPKESPVMNACVVPEGTYEVCSRTINKQASGSFSSQRGKSQVFPVLFRITEAGIC